MGRYSLVLCTETYKPEIGNEVDNSELFILKVRSEENTKSLYPAVRYIGTFSLMTTWCLDE